MNDIATATRKLAPATAETVPGKFAHFVVKTARFDAVRQWYKTVLQARIAMENEMLCFLSYDDEHHRVAIINMPHLKPADAERAGVHHVAFTYRSLADLLANYRRLKGEGIEPVWCINHGPTTSIYYLDPDGLHVELQIDNFATDEALNAYMTGPDFAANPIGVIYEPEELIRRYEAGEPLEALQRRPPLPEGKTPHDMLRL